jgi:hypothetical protein
MRFTLMSIDVEGNKVLRILSVHIGFLFVKLSILEVTESV